MLASWWSAVHCGDASTLHRLLSSHLSLPHATDLFHRTALFHCAMHSRMPCLLVLLPLSPLDVADVHGHTALYKAAVNNHPHAVTLLLSHAASPTLPDLCGDLPLHAAAQHDAALSIAALLFHSSHPSPPNPPGAPPHLHTPLIRAASHGCVASTRALLAHAAVRVEARDGTGATAVVAACKTGNEGVGRVVVEEGGGGVVGVVDDDGDGPLAWAAWAGYEGVVGWLLGLEVVVRRRKREEVVDAVDAAGDTALCKAARMGHVGCVRRLLEQGGATVCLRSVDAAARMGHDACVELLVQHLAMQQQQHHEHEQRRGQRTAVDKSPPCAAVCEADTVPDT